MAIAGAKSITFPLNERTTTFNLDSNVELSNLVVAVRYTLDPLNPESGHAQTLTTKDRRGLREVARLAEQALRSSEFDTRSNLECQIEEIVVAIRNNHRPPLPPTLEGFQVPFFLIRRGSNPVGTGQRMAANLEPNHKLTTDLSRLDPTPSTFWERPVNVAAQDLHAGFGRSKLPTFHQELWTYDGPKRGYGSNPGFDLRSDKRRIKVKFGETISEPLTARFFAALGYHVEPTDHVDFLRMNYDRRAFLEFNSRKDLKTRFQMFGFLPVFSVNLQRHFDPFEFVAGAVMKNGSRMSGEELRRQLLRHPHQTHAADSQDNYQSEVESQIDYLITVPANVQERDDRLESVGPWEFGGLGHEDRRELRGACLLAAWLAWYDSRFENTRLKIETVDGEPRLRHYFTDLGGGLGEGSGFFSGRGELPDRFGWIFTRQSTGVAGRETSVRLVDFKPIEETPAFSEMTLDDARWMARLIAQLTENQIAAALIASGLDSAQGRLYLEKLVSRRDRMICDLGLGREIIPLRIGGVNSRLTYQPATVGPLMATNVDGRKLNSPITAWLVEDGELKRLPASKSFSGRDFADFFTPAR